MATQSFVNLSGGRRTHNIISSETKRKHVISSDKGYLRLNVSVMAVGTEIEEQQQRDWAWGLPSIAVGNIAERLTQLDFLYFSCVCKHWSTVLLNQQLFLPRSPQFPWLMVPKEYSGDDSATRTFLNLPDGRTFDLTAPELRDKRVISSDKGWLVLVDRQYQLSLLEPFTGANLSLPSIFTIPEFNAVQDPTSGSIVGFNYWEYDSYITLDDTYFAFINKVVLSSSPSNPASDCVIVLHHYSTDIVYARPGDSTWSPIERLEPTVFDIYDILFVDSHTLLALRADCSVVKLDFSVTKPHATFLVTGIGDHGFNTDTNIAICGGDLFALVREKATITDPRSDYTGEMAVTLKVGLYKLVTKDGRCRWVRTRNIKGYALFMGTNHCICLAPKDVPGLRENCIYFTDHYGSDIVGELKQATRDVVIFDLIKQSYEFCFPPDNCLTYPPPIWFIPSIY